jgi:hypothetical protein
MERKKKKEKKSKVKISGLKYIVKFYFLRSLYYYIITASTLFFISLTMQNWNFNSLAIVGCWRVTSSIKLCSVTCPNSNMSVLSIVNASKFVTLLLPLALLMMQWSRARLCDSSVCCIVSSHDATIHIFIVIEPTFCFLNFIIIYIVDNYSNLSAVKCNYYLASRSIF